MAGGPPDYRLDPGADWNRFGFDTGRSWTLKQGYRKPSLRDFLRAARLFAIERHVLNAGHQPPDMPVGLPGTPFAGQPITIDLILRYLQPYGPPITDRLPGYMGESLSARQEREDAAQEHWRNDSSRWFAANFPRSRHATLDGGWSILDFKTYVSSKDPRWATFDMAGNFAYGLTGTVLEEPLLTAAPGYLEQFLAAKRCYVDRRPGCNVWAYGGLFSKLNGEKPEGFAAITMGIDYANSGQLLFDFFNDPTRLPSGPARDTALSRIQPGSSAEHELQRRLQDPILQEIEQQQRQREAQVRERQREADEKRKREAEKRRALSRPPNVSIRILEAPHDQDSYRITFGDP